MCEAGHLMEAKYEPFYVYMYSHQVVDHSPRCWSVCRAAHYGSLFVPRCFIFPVFCDPSRLKVCYGTINIQEAIVHLLWIYMHVMHVQYLFNMWLLVVLLLVAAYM